MPTTRTSTWLLVRHGRWRLCALLIVATLSTVSCSGGNSGPSGSTGSLGSDTIDAQSGTAATSAESAPGDLTEFIDDPAVPSGDTTAVAAAEAELALVDAMRADAGFVDLLAPIGQAVLTDVDAARQQFSEAFLPTVPAQLGIELTAAAPAANGFRRTGSAAPAPAPAPAETFDAATWTGDMLGHASATVTMTMAMMSSIVDVAGREDSGSTITSDETYHKQPAEGYEETIHLRTTLRLQSGGGRVSGSVEVVSTDVLTRGGTTIATLIGSGRGEVDVNACPGADGIADGNYSLVLTEELSRPGAPSAGSSSSVSAPLRLVNGDDAHLVQVETTQTVARGAHGPGTPGGDPAAPFDWGVTATLPIVYTPDGRRTLDPSGHYDSNEATDQQIGATIGANYMVDQFIVELAKKTESFWRSGKCIELATGEQSRQVEPEEQVGLEMTATGKFDGAEIDAPITATLGGAGNLDPVDTPQDPPARVTYTAGQLAGETGTLTVEQISRRGIGRAELVFTVHVLNLSVSLSGTYTATGLGNSVTATISMPPTALRRDPATGRYQELAASIHVTATFAGLGGCTADIDGDDPVSIFAVPDEADSTLFRLTIEVDSGELPMYTITCNGALAPQVPALDALPVWALAMIERELQLGGSTVLDTSVVQGQATVSGSSTVELVELP